jgi:outer membrane protein OmpA-like peptidoglycan-associated protein
MSGPRLAYFAFAALLMLTGAQPSQTATIGYAEALGDLAANCGRDINRYCSKANLGGGEVAQCLERHSSRVTSACKASATRTAALLQQRSRARASVRKVCELDRLRFCGGIQPGDAQILGCMYQARAHLSQPCRQALIDSGYEAALDPGPLGSQIHLTSGNILGSLAGAAQNNITIDVARMRKMAEQAAHDPSRANPLNRPPVFAQLNNLAQLTIAVEFDLNSARIKPKSYRAIGLMADALYHPVLYGYCFLIVGHTDVTGRRDYNLKLSERRAQSVQEALANPFGIPHKRVEEIGLGEEQLLDPRHPKSGVNRRVQLINVGQIPNNPQCPVVPLQEIR